MVMMRMIIGRLELRLAMETCSQVRDADCGNPSAINLSTQSKEDF